MKDRKYHNPIHHSVETFKRELRTSRLWSPILSNSLCLCGGWGGTEMVDPERQDTVVSGKKYATVALCNFRKMKKQVSRQAPLRSKDIDG